MTERRTRAWWERTVARWRRSGQTSAQFAASEGLRAGTLLWWSSRLGNDTRAAHGKAEVTAIEIAMPVASGAPNAAIEIALGDTVVRCDAGVDVEYLASLVRAIRRS